MELTVYDMLGRTVEKLVDGHQDAGFYKMTFDGSRFPRGIYLLSMRTGSFSKGQKLMVLK